ncbi:hypothetical protein NKH77_29910 [Streptomyces sp. M19]
MRLDLSGLRHVDHACGMALAGWAERHNATAAGPDSGPDSGRCSPLSWRPR